MLPSSQMYYGTLCVAGLAFGGLGVWCMHFIGTLALQLPVAVHYSLDTTLLSLVAAVLASICGLGIVAANPYSLPRLVCAGAILGVGVSAMHYLGMYSMEFDGFFLWDWPLVAMVGESRKHTAAFTAKHTPKQTQFFCLHRAVNSYSTAVSCAENKHTQ